MAEPKYKTVETSKGPKLDIRHETTMIEPPKITERPVKEMSVHRKGKP